MKKRGMVLLAGVLVAVVAMIVVQVTSDSVSTGAWGLSFQQEGMAPNGPASADQLAQFDAAYVGKGDKKEIYLTFDAGYENGCTEKILDILKTM